MKKFPIWWAPVILVVGILVCVALLWTHQLTSEGVNVEDSSQAEPIVASLDSTLAEDPSRFNTPDRNTNEQPQEREGDLFQLCPDPQSDLSPDCWQRLDQLLWDKPLGVHSEFLLLPTSLTYRRIYADPANDRNLVLQAIQREECRLENGNYRLDYREQCNAESFVNFASFLAACESNEDKNYQYEWFEPHQIHKGKTRFQLELDHIEQYRTVDPDGFDRARNEIWLDALESRWRERQCLDHDMSVFRIGSDVEEREPLSLISLKWIEEQSHRPASTLVLIAARLGGAGILPQYIFENHLAGSARWVVLNYLEEHDPWVGKLTESLIPFLTRSKRMHAAIEAIVALQEKGWEIDLEKLVTRVCQDESITRVYEARDERLPSASSCREAIGQLSASIPQSNFRELKVLDEFERIALELGVYDPPQRELERE